MSDKNKENLKKVFGSAMNIVKIIGSETTVLCKNVSSKVKDVISTDWKTDNEAETAEKAETSEKAETAEKAETVEKAEIVDEDNKKVKSKKNA